MKQDVARYVASCSICQQAKSEHIKLPGKLQPLPIPPAAWHTISLDFIKGLPKSNKFDSILVVIDKFTKFGHFIPVKHPFTASSIAQAFMDTVYKNHGLPQVIISNRDKIFISNFWQQLFKLADTTLNLSSSYHPQTDGQTERLNQCLKTYLRCLVHAKPDQWARWLPQAEYWYNTAFHSALGKSPFEVLYGRTPRHFAVHTDTSAVSTDVEVWLKEREAMLPVIK
jgi:transposase InsO family protein